MPPPDARITSSESHVDRPTADPAVCEMTVSLSHPQVGKPSDAEHPDAPGLPRLLIPLPARADFPEQLPQILKRHPEAVVPDAALLADHGHLDLVGWVA